MELRQLRYFVAVADTLNFSRAAESLYLSQSALSKQIQSLEASYGVRLFSYDGRKLRKTKQGEILERYAIGLQYNDEELERMLAEKPKTLIQASPLPSFSRRT